MSTDVLDIHLSLVIWFFDLDSGSVLCKIKFLWESYIGMSNFIYIIGAFDELDVVGIVSLVVLACIL